MQLDPLSWPLVLAVVTALALVALVLWRFKPAIATFFDHNAGANPFRMMLCGAAAVACLAVVAIVSPVQLPVAVYKLALVLLAGYLGYWLDVWLFPYSRPDGYLASNWQIAPGFKRDQADHAIVDGYALVFAFALIRRALIVGFCMLAVGLGL